MKIKRHVPAISFLCSLIATGALASDFAKLDEALPTDVDAYSIAPVFDFDTDGCLPSAGISRRGEQNGGLKPTGNITGGCRSSDFLESSNTFHRYACVRQSGVNYCGHLFTLYFEKDQIFSGIRSGHRHDWEHAVVWTRNEVVTHASYSAHGDLFTKKAANLAFENGHVKIVYHKDGIGTHAFRFGGADEVAENPYGWFIIPDIVSWYEGYGDNLDNQELRRRLNRFNYGSANFPISDSKFRGNLNNFRPEGFPEFTQQNIIDANPSPEMEYLQLVNWETGLCLDVFQGNMSPGTSVIQWHCSGADWQKWGYNKFTGLIHSKDDPDYCLDNGGLHQNGSNIFIELCDGSDGQRFFLNANSVAMRVKPELVLDGNYQAGPGEKVIVWESWLGNNQSWIWIL